MYRTAATGLDERVREAQARCAELHRLQARRAGIVAELKEAEAEIARLSKLVVSENADVARFERGVWAFLYDLVADGEARLSKEKAEAAAATARYQEAIGHHARLRQGLDDVDGQLAGLDGAEAALAEAQAAKLDELMARGGAIADELTALDADAATVGARLAHVDEALTAGANVLTTLGRVAQRLEEARGWDPMNLILGAESADRQRRDRYDRARGLAGTAQAELTMFQRELADLGLALDVRLGPTTGDPAFTAYRPGFVELWLSDMLAASTVTVNIGQALDTTRGVTTAVEATLATLRTQRAELEARAAHLDAQLAALTAGG